MKTIGNFFAVRSGDWDEDVLIYSRKPKTKRERVRDYNWSTGRKHVTTEQLDDFGNLYSVDLDAIKKMTGRSVPKGKIVEFEVIAEPTGKGFKRVFAARVNDYVELFRTKPEIETKEQEFTEWNGSSYEPVTRPVTKIKGDEEANLGSYCVFGFRKAVGLTPPKKKVTPLGVRVKNITAIPASPKIRNA